MRIGKVMLSFCAVVDIDNPEMVERAKDMIIDDITYAVVKDDSIANFIYIVEDPTLTEQDLDSLLTESD